MYVLQYQLMDLMNLSCYKNTSAAAKTLPMRYGSRLCRDVDIVTCVYLLWWSN
jgi:hypothetical protein